MLIFGHLGQGHSSWDPLAIIVLAAVGWVFLRGPAGRSERRRFWFVAALLVLTVAVASPLDSLAGDLASAHMAQHILLILVAGPLLALSRPVEGLMGGLPRRWRKTVGRARRTVRLTPDKRRMFGPVLVWMAYGASLWLWHAAALYELALDNEVIHLVEHSFFIVAAVAFWSLILLGRREPPISRGFRGLMVFTTAFHSVLLAALVTFAETPWYPAYADTTTHWGLTPIDDQRLAGLLMWIPGGLLYTGVGLWLVLGWVRQSGGVLPEGAGQGSPRRQ
jgi:putative membrane protein